MTPYEAVYGKPPTLIPHYPRRLLKVEAVDSILIQRNEVLSCLKAHLQRARNRMKVQADKNSRDRTFNVGDLVWLCLQPYRQVFVFHRANHKLAARFFGPFPIEQKLSDVAYKLELPPGSQIHPTFHVSLLKPFVHSESSAAATIPLPLVAIENRPLQETLAVVAKRLTQSTGEPHYQFLVQWTHSVLEDST
ncbi:uncharacterized protein LOC133290685 [Gastrolobium bilobum]|uniref:uncharacterized protein LOC133290685 n=1 Tax=Gastrolobium bilobum TaxID=150636 RepID=UPI002AB08C77|nr:uncharacterized protein LOC133290685 [Gastrolobium bilobum]